MRKTREIYVAHASDVRNLREVRRHLRYVHPTYRVEAVRRADPMKAERGFIARVSYEEG